MLPPLAGTVVGQHRPQFTINVGNRWHCEEIRGLLSITGRHAVLDRVVPTKHTYHQISALPHPVLMSIDNPNSLSPLDNLLKHLPPALTIAVLMREAVRCMTLQQLSLRYADNSAFVCARTGEDLPVTCTPLVEA